jgi:YVTN family beta-propeller protein
LEAFRLVSITIFALSAASVVHAVGVTSTITVGPNPWGVAYDSGKGETFVVNSGNNSVSVISDSNNAVLATITVRNQPYRVIYDSGRGEIFVTNYAANSVSVISDSTNTIVATVPVGTHPASFAYDSGKGEIFVANTDNDTVSVISDTTNTVVATVPVGNSPYDLAYDSAKGKVFIANALSRSVSVISDETNTVVATIHVGSGPLGVAYDSVKGQIFVVNSVSNSVSIISDSTNTVVATPAVGANPGPIAYDSGTGEIYVANKDSGSVSVISDVNNSVVSTFNVGTKPYGITYNSGKGELFVANYADGTISVISDSSSTSASPIPSASVSPSPTAIPTPTPAQTTEPSSTPALLQQVWVPQPTNALVAVGVSAAVVGAVSLIFAAISNPLGGLGGKVGEKTADLVPDKIKDWLQEIVSSRRKLRIEEKSGSLFKPTKPEALAYVTAIIVLAVSFSYVKVITLDQIWALLPVFFATSVLVGFVQKFFSIAFMRSRGVWSEHKIWPLGLVLFLFTTFAFEVPFSSPTRSVHQETKFTERLGALVSTSEILISLAFAGFFLLLLSAGYSAIGGAGLAMCVIGSFFGTFPLAPMSGKELFDHSKRLWAGLFITTVIILVAWLLLM